MFVKRNLDHPSRAKVRQHVADHCGVTVERLLEVIAKRKAYKKAKYFRDWKRTKAVREKGAGRVNLRKKPDEPYAQEGELHLMLRVIGMSAPDFCAMIGMSYGTFSRWYGTALYDWPLELMRYYAWSQNMAAHLRSKGIDPEQFQPKLPKMNRPGSYPRKKGDVVVKMPEPEYSPYRTKAR